MENYFPTNFAQKLKVESIAVSYWKSMRSIRCERGDLEIWSPPPEPENHINLLDMVPSSEACESLLKTSNGIETLIANVEVAQMEVEDNGTIPQDVLDWLTLWTDTLSPSKADLLAALEREKTRLRVQHRRVRKDEIRKANAKHDL